MATFSQVKIVDGNTETVADVVGSEHYGVCSTAASTQVKVVTIAGITSLYTGLSIKVKFENAQTYNGVPRLNLNGLGAADIIRTTQTNAARYEWVTGEIISLTYSGSKWMLTDGGFATTTYYGVTKLNNAISTSQSLALTPYGGMIMASDTLYGTYITAYSSSTSYAVNNVCYHLGEVWKCTTAANKEAWTPSHWTSLGHLKDLNYITYYSTAETYEIGGKVWYGKVAYKCNTAISTAEAWTAAHWTQITPLQAQIDDKSVASASINSSGLISYKNSVGTSLFTLQLPLYDGSVT